MGKQIKTPATELEVKRQIKRLDKLTQECDIAEIMLSISCMRAALAWTLDSKDELAPTALADVLYGVSKDARRAAKALNKAK